MIITKMISMKTMVTMRIRRYSELMRYDSFDDRYEYLKLGGEVGRSTFGFDRHINQTFYRSSQWKSVRDFVIVRDNGCDLAVPGHEIHTELLVHHMNPMTVDDILHGEEWILDPEYLICVCHNTHNAIHYGDKSLLPTAFVERRPGDTKLW